MTLYRPLMNSYATRIGQASVLGSVLPGVLSPAVPTPSAPPATTAADQVDPQRLRIQQDLYHTQFYKGRLDGRGGGDTDARMTAAITLVQLHAGLPPTGIYDDAVHRAINAYFTSGGSRWTEETLPTTTTGPAPPTPPAPTAPTAGWHWTPLTATLAGITTGMALGFATVLVRRRFSSRTSRGPR